MDETEKSQPHTALWLADLRKDVFMRIYLNGADIHQSILDSEKVVEWIVSPASRPTQNIQEKPS